MGAPGSGGDAAAPQQADERDAEAEFRRVLAEHLSRQDVAEGDIPAAFAAARERNADVRAWLWVPGTNVNVPVCQRASDRYYYMRHDADGETVAFGAAFLEAESATDFADPVTVVYGHSLVDAELLFTQLHRFEDPAFAQQHRSFRIYLPEETLVYRVVSAKFIGNESILSRLGLYDIDSLQAHFDEFCGEEGVLDAASDRIVHLVTCDVPPDEARRYVVTGVLEGEEPAEGEAQ